MSLLSSIAGNFGKALVGAFKTSLSQVANAVAPGVTNLLQSIVGSAFDGIKALSTTGLSMLPGPFGLVGKLLAPLLGKGIDALKGLSQQGVEKLVTGLNNKIQERTVGGQQVNVPQMGERAATVSTQSAATAQDISTGKYDTAIQANSASIGDIAGTNLSAEEQELLKTMEPKDRARYMLQKRMQEKSEITALLSNLQSMRHQAAMSVIGNIR